MQTLNRYMWHHVFSYCEPKDAVSLQTALKQEGADVLRCDSHATLDHFNWRSRDHSLFNRRFDLAAFELDRYGIENFVLELYSSILFEYFTDNHQAFFDLKREDQMTIFQVISSAEIRHTACDSREITRDNVFAWQLKAEWAQQLSTNHRVAHWCKYEIGNSRVLCQDDFQRWVTGHFNPELIPPDLESFDKLSYQEVLWNCREVFSHVKFSRRYLYSMMIPILSHGLMVDEKFKCLLSSMNVFRYDPYQDFIAALESELAYADFRKRFNRLQNAKYYCLAMNMLVCFGAYIFGEIKNSSPSYILGLYNLNIGGWMLSLGCMPNVLTCLFLFQVFSSPLDCHQIYRPERDFSRNFISSVKNYSYDCISWTNNFTLPGLMIKAINFFRNPLLNNISKIIVPDSYFPFSLLSRYVGLLLCPSRFIRKNTAFLLTKMNRVEQMNLCRAANFVARDHEFSDFHQLVIRELQCELRHHSQRHSFAVRDIDHMPLLHPSLEGNNLIN